MQRPRSSEQARINLQRRVITWLLLAGTSFLVANAWLIVHMFGAMR